MFQTKVLEKIKTHFIINNFFFFENHSVYEIMWKNILKPDRPQMTIWRMRFACWITKATATHSECVILIAFPLQPWLHERASMLCFMYVVCLLLFLVEIWFQILLSSWFSCSCVLLVQLLGSYFRTSILLNCEVEITFQNLIKL